jgi:hypothetical protein
MTFLRLLVVGCNWSLLDLCSHWNCGFGCHRLLYRRILWVSTTSVLQTNHDSVPLLRNLPFGLCPGLGLTAYVVYGMILGNSYSLTQAFTAVSSNVLLRSYHKFISRFHALSSVLNFRPLAGADICLGHFSLPADLDPSLCSSGHRYWNGPADRFGRYACCYDILTTLGRIDL